MMKKQLIGVVVALFLLSLPSAAMASQGGMGEMQGMKGIIVLGTDTQAGVKAMAHLMSVPQPMSSNSAGILYHFMVMFNNEKSGAPITGGLVALKIFAPSGAVRGPIRLMPMTMGLVKGFGAGVRVIEHKKYRFEVGCRLLDGRKRQFNFTATIK